MANANLALSCIVTFDGLGCIAGVGDASCQHQSVRGWLQTQGLARIQLD
ncbi:MAG: hypothetical protein Q7T85_10670 [Nitrosomonas sp.]|nr:hypothetical protein [Nitrosomonas sp.]